MTLKIKIPLKQSPVEINRKYDITSAWDIEIWLHVKATDS